MDGFRESTNIIDLRDAWLPVLLWHLPLLVGWVGVWLITYDWRERIGLALLALMFFMTVAQ